jgi:hypothetical protein
MDRAGAAWVRRVGRFLTLILSLRELAAISELALSVMKIHI